MRNLFFETAFVGGRWAEDVRVAVSRDGDIESVEPGARPGSAERIAGVAVPGVPNLHSHAFQRAMAGLGERGGGAVASFWSWRDLMYRFVAVLEPEDVQCIAAQLHVELLRHGFTAVAEFHYLRNARSGRPYADPVEMGQRILAAAAETGIGVTILPVLYRASGFGGAPLEEAQRRFGASVEELVGDLLVLDDAARALGGRAGLALHSLRAVPADDLTVAVDAVRELDASAPVHIHVAEQLREVDECLAWSGARPVEWLLDHAHVDPAWCLVHATHVDEDEVAAIAACGAVVGLCPTTEANLADGVFPLAELGAGLGAWGVGTDAHVGVSPVGELRLLEYGQRLTRGARNVAPGAAGGSTGRALLEGAWSGGASACGRPLGALEAGRRADVVVLDPLHPALVGRDGDALLDAWVFSGDDTPVRDVMVGGRWVVRDGRHEREEQVLEQYRAVARRVAARVAGMAD